MNPKEASQTKNETKFWRNPYGNYISPKRQAPKFSLGDKARITRKKRTFEKGYTPRWTEEVFFTVSDVRYTDPTTYKITDCKNDEIKGSFYESELQKATQEMFRIEKVKEEKVKNLS